MQMSSIKDVALWKAMEEGDVNKVRESLEQGANPNYSVENTLVIEEALNKSYVEIVKLLVQFGAKLEDDYDFFQQIFYKSEIVMDSKELVSHFIKYNKDVKLLQIFASLAYDNEVPTLKLEILKLLLDNGLPVNEFIPDYCWGDDGDQLTPLHMSIWEDREDFISLLLEHGADVHKKTGLGMSCLWVAAFYGNESVVKLLVNRGVNINEKFLRGRTALHRACMEDDGNAIYALCKYGADVNILDDLGRPPCMYISVFTENKELIIAKFAKLRFENQYLCPENLQFVQRDERLRKTFENCLEELRKMKNLKFYNGFSVYDVFKMRHQTRKLTFLMKNDDFVAAFNSCWNRKLFKHYSNDINEIFQDSLTKKNILVAEEEKLNIVFKDFLPELVLRKVALFIHKHLFSD